MRISRGSRHGWRNLFQSLGGTIERQKNYRKLLRFELATVTSHALKYDVITYTPHQGPSLLKNFGGGQILLFACR